MYFLYNNNFFILTITLNTNKGGIKGFRSKHYKGNNDICKVKFKDIEFKNQNKKKTEMDKITNKMK